MIRFDLILVLILLIFVFISKQDEPDIFNDKVSKILGILIIFSIFMGIFSEWPGSVIKIGLPNYLKAIVFYYFTVSFLNTEKKLKIFLIIFIGCQTYRILEPLYLHIVTGYWGDQAYVGGGEFIERLSGAPMDIVNPNGLAFIIDTVIPFLIYSMAYSRINNLISFVIIPLSLYALVLTGSRSGLLGLFMIIGSVWFKSKKKIALGFLITITGLIIFINLTPDQQDRYLSIFNQDTKNAATAQGRVEGMVEDLKIAVKRPITGHGLGTSKEANYHYRGNAIYSHNLYTEIAEEIGFIGLIIFIIYIKTIIITYYRVSKTISLHDNIFLKRTNDSMIVWLVMNMLFSFASYGLSSYEWYLFAGFSTVMMKLTTNDKMKKNIQVKN